MIRFLIIFLLTFKSHCSDLPVQSSAPLGLPTPINDLYIPGSKVEVIPRKNNESSLVIRILEIKPAADGFRYDLEAYALDPGTHNLSDFLRYADTKAPIENLDATFQVTTIHPLDSLPKPSDPKPVPPKKLGGYKTLIIVLGIIWLLILLAIIFYRKKKLTNSSTQAPPPTLHEKLQALVTSASEGNLTDTERAKLELLILGHWKQKLPEIGNLPPAKALVQLRSHPEASPLILKLEEWLHAPSSSTSHQEIIPLLAPYLPKS